MIKKIIIISIFAGLILPSFSLTAQVQLQPPENLDEAKKIGEKALEVSKKELPGIVEKIWKEEVLPVWQKMYDWFRENIWERYILPFFKKEVEPRTRQEIEKRKPIIQEEFQKEEKELKEEVPIVGKSLWEKFKDIIK